MNGIRYISAENRVADTCPGGRLPKVSWRLWQARPSCLRLLVHLMRAAASRTFWTAGRSRPIRMAMIAITTNSSISVNARRWEGRDMADLRERGGARERGRAKSPRIEVERATRASGLHSRAGGFALQEKTAPLVRARGRLPDPVLLHLRVVEVHPEPRPAGRHGPAAAEGQRL